MFKIIFPRFLFKIERWKWNKEYRVYVSNQGHFKDEHKKNIPLKVYHTGYCAIFTPYGMKQAHRLVMLTWVPIPNAESMTVDHLDHNKRNNSLENLEWVTNEENLSRAQIDFLSEVPVEKRTYIVISNEHKKFYSYEEAAKWIKQQANIKHKKVDEIAIRLENIIRQSPTKKFYGYTWEVNYVTGEKY